MKKLIALLLAALFALTMTACPPAEEQTDDAEETPAATEEQPEEEQPMEDEGGTEEGGDEDGGGEEGGEEGGSN